MREIFSILTVLIAGFVLASCDTKTKNVKACGDGFVDPGEDCDTDVGENSCLSLGHYNQVGTLLCTSLCKFDRQDCGGRCGDSNVDEADGEQCDSLDLNGNSCQSLGHGGGTLQCTPTCQYDRSDCTSACGNGYVEGGEACDDGNNREDDGCFSDCTVEDGWTCDLANPSHCDAVCMDGLVVGTEECDSDQLNGRSCESLGYYGGTLTCNGTCDGFDESACISEGRCGDDQIQTEHGEICDGSDFNGQTCISLGFYGGTLVCDGDCHGFSSADCSAEGRCGDDAIQASYGESCDGSNSNGSTCETEGFYPGTLVCADCSFVYTSCGGSCGDGIVQAPYETCDGGDLNGETCESLQYHGGALACTASCTYDVAPCAAVGRCGDGVIQSAFGEQCEGGNLNSASCQTLGFPGEILDCSSQCSYRLGLCDFPFRFVPAGTFQRDDIVTNTSTVSAFWMSQHEITREQFEMVMGVDSSNPVYSSGKNDPVQKVNWYHAIAFCNKLSLMEGKTPVYSVSGVDFGALSYAQIPLVSNATWNAVTANWSADGYRLPTEMEWMWAAMGATNSRNKAFAGSTGSNLIGDYAVFGFGGYETGRTTTERTNPVGSKLPNELGIYDLSGNVWEWCWDWHGTYPSGALTDYTGASSSTVRILRGCGWYNDSTYCTVATRSGTFPQDLNYYRGFRVVRR